jgi:hypothetical protein
MPVPVTVFERRICVGLELFAKVGDGMKGFRGRIVGVLDASNTDRLSGHLSLNHPQTPLTGY